MHVHCSNALSHPLFSPASVLIFTDWYLFFSKIILHFLHALRVGTIRGVVANVPDCDIMVSESELQSLYYI